MGLTTPRYALRYPVAADADNVPSDMLNLATDLDNKMGGWSTGLLSARPAFGVSGRRYRATDNGFEYLDIGTAWVTSAEPKADGAQTILAYNAAWPSSPVGGQEVDRFASTAGDVVWRFRYNALGGTYKWQFVGGPAYQSSTIQAIPVATNRTGTGWTKCTGGPHWSPGVVGIYDIRYIGLSYVTPSGVNMWLTLSSLTTATPLADVTLQAAGPIGTITSLLGFTASLNQVIDASPGQADLVAGFPGAVPLTAYAANAGAGSGQIAGGFVAVTPVRCG
jgi:hypothetical protein